MTKEQLREIREEKEQELRAAEAMVIGTARSIAADHRAGRRSSPFLLDLLCAATAAQEQAQKETIAASEAVVKALGGARP